MKKEELLKLKELIINETNRRKRINELLDNKLVKEYFELTNKKQDKITEEELEILKYILNDFKVTKTNGIYVCTCAIRTDYHICYEETEYYSEYIDINSNKAEKKRYVNIESNEDVIGTIEKEDNRPLISEFERNNIVLNPYNTSENSNGFYEVKNEFFMNCIKYGNIKSKNMILKKYKRL